jgi:predicted nucleic acid-binding protein
VKVIADTCAWSLLLRRKIETGRSDDEQSMRTALTEAIQDGRVAIIGPIRQEVLSGIKDIAQFDKLKAALKSFPDEPLTTIHYEEAARLFNICRSRGVECGSTDILICAVAAEKHWTILTNDGGIKRCIEVLQAQGLMQ